MVDSTFSIFGQSGWHLSRKEAAKIIDGGESKQQDYKPKAAKRDWNENWQCRECEHMCVARFLACNKCFKGRRPRSLDHARPEYTYDETRNPGFLVGKALRIYEPLTNKWRNAECRNFNELEGLHLLVFAADSKLDQDAFIYPPKANSKSSGKKWLRLKQRIFTVSQLARLHEESDKKTSKKYVCNYPDYNWWKKWDCDKCGCGVEALYLRCKKCFKGLRPRSFDPSEILFRSGVEIVNLNSILDPLRLTISCKDLLQGKGVTAETLCKAKSTDELGKLLSEVNVKPGHIAKMKMFLFPDDSTATKAT